jgi:hypothetical protein
MKWIGRALVILLLSILLAAMTTWGALAIYYSNLPGEGLRTILAALFAFFGIALLIWYLFSTKRTRPCFTFFAVFLLLVAWWSTIPASQDRDWAPEYAKPAYATIKGDLVTIHNIRNFDYRTETDYTPRYYTKTLDLRQLDSVDVIASYWMGDAIAHIFLSFGFAGKDFIAISIETRRERQWKFRETAALLPHRTILKASGSWSLFDRRPGFVRIEFGHGLGDGRGLWTEVFLIDDAVMVDDESHDSGRSVLCRIGHHAEAAHHFTAD